MRVVPDQTRVNGTEQGFGVSFEQEDGDTSGG